MKYHFNSLSFTNFPTQGRNTYIWYFFSCCFRLSLKSARSAPRLVSCLSFGFFGLFLILDESSLSKLDLSATVFQREEDL